MFERFGEMSSCREINELAENLLNEGDIQSLKVMAQENGIPEDYVIIWVLVDFIVTVLSELLTVIPSGSADVVTV